MRENIIHIYNIYYTTTNYTTVAFQENSVINGLLAHLSFDSATEAVTGD